MSRNNRIIYVQDEAYIFARNLRKLRMQRKPILSQKKLAELLGICRTTYIDYELGRRLPPAHFVMNAAKYFNIDVNKFMREEL